MGQLRRNSHRQLTGQVLFRLRIDRQLQRTCLKTRPFPSVIRLSRPETRLPDNVNRRKGLEESLELSDPEIEEYMISDDQEAGMDKEAF